MEPLRILLTGSRQLQDRTVVIRALSDASAIPPDDTPFVVRHGGNGMHKAPFVACHGRNGTQSLRGDRSRIESADAIAHSVWTDWHYAFGPRWLLPEVYPADWNQHGKAAGALRNTQMLEDGKIDICVALPLPGSIGTYDMIRKVRAAGIPWVNAIDTDNDWQRLHTWRELVANDPRNRQEVA